MIIRLTKQHKILGAVLTNFPVEMNFQVLSYKKWTLTCGCGDGFKDDKTRFPLLQLTLHLEVHCYQLLFIQGGSSGALDSSCIPSIKYHHKRNTTQTIIIDFYAMSSLLKVQQPFWWCVNPYFLIEILLTICTFHEFFFVILVKLLINFHP